MLMIVKKLHCVVITDIVTYWKYFLPLFLFSVVVVIIVVVDDDDNDDYGGGGDNYIINQFSFVM
jgi:hypothetical protein